MDHGKGGGQVLGKARLAAADISGGLSVTLAVHTHSHTHTHAGSLLALCISLLLGMYLEVLLRTSVAGHASLTSGGAQAAVSMHVACGVRLRPGRHMPAKIRILPLCLPMSPSVAFGQRAPQSFGGFESAC